MKRTELKPGQDYYLNRTQDWERYPGGSTRVRVITTDRWFQSRSFGVGARRPVEVNGITYDLPETWYPYPQGDRVLVEELTHEGEPHPKPACRLVTPAQIKDTWQGAQERIQAYAARDRRAKAVQAERQRVATERKATVVQRLGLKSGGYGLNEVRISIQDAEDLADRLGL